MTAKEWVTSKLRFAERDLKCLKLSFALPFSSYAEKVYFDENMTKLEERIADFKQILKFL